MAAEHQGAATQAGCHHGRLSSPGDMGAKWAVATRGPAAAVEGKVRGAVSNAQASLAPTGVQAELTWRMQALTWRGRRMRRGGADACEDGRGAAAVLSLSCCRQTGRWCPQAV